MPSAGSFEAPSSVDANQLQETETITCMGHVFYHAAAEGRIQVLRNAQEPLDRLLTPNKNTILHIYLTAIYFTEKRSLKTKFVRGFLGLPPQTLQQTATNFVAGILDICPPLLRKCNAKYETPLHIAARHGHAAIVKALIQRIEASCTDLERQANETREMLRMLNKEKDTALHEAVRYNHLEVVKLLLAKEDPDFVYSANDAGETLLYMAVERGFRDVVFKILGTCNSPAYTGPLGRTALHAAVFWNDEEIIEKVLDKIATLAKMPDQKGWTPLRLAAYFGCSKAAKALLERDGQVAYMKDTEGRTALHIAIGMSNRKVVRMILSHCPYCCEIIDKKGRNIVHFSVESRWPMLTTNLLLKYPFVNNFLNERDVYGNTVLLHHFKSPYHVVWSLLQHPRVDKMAFNNQNLNVLDIALAAGKLSMSKVSS